MRESRVKFLALKVENPFPCINCDMVDNRQFIFQRSSHALPKYLSSRTHLKNNLSFIFEWKIRGPKPSKKNVQPNQIGYKFFRALDQ